MNLFRSAPAMIWDLLDTAGRWAGDHPGTLIPVAAGIALATIVLQRGAKK
jgi:hypothetical protein